MLMEEIELFKDLSPEFMNQVSAICHEESYLKDQSLFKRGDTAEDLYILMDGCVSLYIRNGGSLNFTLDKPGMVFGWSSLVEPKRYTMTAECYDNTRALRIEATRLEHVFDKYPREAYRIMKRLAGVVGRRLANSYEENIRSHAEGGKPSYG